MNAPSRRLPRRWSRAVHALHGLVLCHLGAIWAAGQEPAVDQTVAADVIAATVNGVDIAESEIDYLVARRVRGVTLEHADRQRLRAAALEQLVDQRLVLSRLQELGEACSPRELELATTQLRRELGRQDQSLEDYCRAHGLSVAALVRTLEWQLSWSRYLEKMLTDERLRRHFEEHRRDFDGTRLQVAHILLALPAEPHEQPTALERAAAIRERIVSGQIAFAEAARQYSQGPSAADGGELGWITRSGPMSDSFTRAAFALQVGEVSAPVISPFGIHLIVCRSVEPGQVRWEEVRRSLRTAVAQELFRGLADEARRTAVIRRHDAPSAHSRSVSP